MAYQCSDLTGTAINEMETWAKREGMHILFLAVWQIPAAKKKKKIALLFHSSPQPSSLSKVAVAWHSVLPGYSRAQPVHPAVPRPAATQPPSYHFI